jgi:hypothetical protein
MGDLTASIAHEINQPLAAIVTHSEAALEFLDRDDPDLDEARDSLLSIAKYGMRAGEVIRGLRALAGKSGPQLTKLDIDDVIKQVLALTRRELLRHDVVLRTVLNAADRPVMGDRVQLQQVLLNLIMNGVEAMRTVTERTRELRVSPSNLARPRPQVTRGKGIRGQYKLPTHRIHHAFLPFSRSPRPELKAQLPATYLFGASAYAHPFDDFRANLIQSDVRKPSARPSNGSQHSTRTTIGRGGSSDESDAVYGSEQRPPRPCGLPQ